LFFRIPGIDSLYIQINDEESLGVYDSSGNSITIQDESTDIGSVNKINFVGAGVVTSVANGIATVQIANGGGGVETADGNNYPVSISIINGVATIGRFGMSDISYSFSTTDIPEGVNQYFSNSRARSALSVTTGLTYNVGAGQFGLDTNFVKTLISTDKRLSSITAATALNTINNGNFAQTWNWTGQNSGTSLALSSTGNTGIFSENATLKVTNSATNSAGNAENFTAVFDNTGVPGGSGGSSLKTGVAINVYGNNFNSGGENKGLNISSSGGQNTKGIYVSSLGTAGSSQLSRAIDASAGNANINTGVLTTAFSSATATNYGVYSTANGNATSTNYAYFGSVASVGANNYAAYLSARNSTNNYALYTDSGLVRIGYLTGAGARNVKVNARGELYASDTASTGTVTVSNLGSTGGRVFAQKIGDVFELRRIQSGTNITVVETPEGIVINAPSGSVYTSNNGITAAGNNFQLGGSLTQNTSLLGAGYSFSLSNVNSLLLGSSGSITLSASSGVPEAKILLGSTQLLLNRQYTTNSTIETALSIGRSSSGIAATGIGGKIQLGVETSDVSYVEAGSIQYSFTNVTAGARTSNLDFYIKNNNADELGLRINGNKNITIPGYVSAREDGPTSKALYVDNSGNIQYGTITGGGGSDGNNYPTSLTVNAGLLTIGRSGLSDLVATLSTNHVTENTNLYFTDARARNAISGGPGILYNPTTGQIQNSNPDQIVTITAGANVTVTGSYPNFTVAAASGSSVSAGNGLTLSAGTVLLGGALSQANTTITGTTGQNLVISGVGNLHFSGNNVSLENNGGTAGYNIVSGVNEIFAMGGNNTVNSVLRISSETSGVFGATGMGGSLDYLLPNTGGTLLSAGKLITRWNNAGAESSSFDLQLLNGGISTTRFSVSSLGNVTISGYPNTRNDGSTTSALYVDATGNVKHGPISVANGVYTERTLIGTATFWNAALDISDGNIIRNALKVGDGSDATKRTITLNTVFFVPVTSFGGVSNWVQCGLITDATFRPTHTIHFRGSSVIDATKYKNSGNTNFTGTASYGDVNLRIDRNGQIFVYISSINTHAQLSGSNIIMVPINVTYFTSASD
jgi:hypothetical protein